MNKFLAWLEKNLAGPMARLSEQRHLLAIRDGVISALPFIIVGSFFLIAAFPPVPEKWAIAVWAKEHIAQILIPYRLTMFIMSLYISFGIGHNLAKSYGLDPLSGGQMAAGALLLTIIPQAIDGSWYLPMTYLGGQGLFGTMIVSILAVEILRFFKTKNLTIKMPEQVPQSVYRSFESLFPVAFLILLMTLISVVFHLDIHELIGKAIEPIVKVGDSLFGVLIPVFLTAFFWAFGIHGDSIVGTVARPVWEVYIAKNAEAVASGAQHLPHIAPEPFFQWFVSIGGTGATIGLVLAVLIFGRSKYLRTVAKASFFPGLFNINEPVIFGMPIVLNPLLMIPFVIIPIVNAVIAYVVMSIGWVSPPYVLAPWTLPGPIGSFLATGGDLGAVVLNIVNIAIALLIYMPFMKVYDRQMLKAEQEEVSETSIKNQNLTV